MNKPLTEDRKRIIRISIRNFLLIATKEELQAELAISVEYGDKFRAECVRELIAETAHN